MGELIFDVRDVSCRYPAAGEPALHDVALQVRAGELVAVAGPNGSGKTTLLRVLLGLLVPERGSVAVAQRPVAAWNRRALARLVGVVAQREEPAFPVRVRGAVTLGRYPHLGPLAALRPADRAAVDRALGRCDAEHLADRWVTTLSGGEWQRVRIARALAQEPRALLLDEPTANLDVRHEMDVFELVAALVRGDGLAGVLITHHLNLAARFVDRIILLDRGRVAASGTPVDVVRRAILEPVFGWPLAVTDWRGVPQFVPLKREEEVA
jgi:iron complex transport system ATP-binding protein